MKPVTLPAVPLGYLPPETQQIGVLVMRMSEALDLGLTINNPTEFERNDSVPNACWKTLDYSGKECVLGVWKFTGRETTIETAWRQPFSYGEAVALELLARGVPVDDIVVPTIAFNGRHLRIGVVFVLDPSFTVHVPVAREFDLADVDVRAEVGAVLKKAQAQTRRLKELVRLAKRPTERSPLRDVLLNMSGFHKKSFEPDTLERGFDRLGLPELEFSGDQLKLTSARKAMLIIDFLIGSGLAHMFRVLTVGYSSSFARDFIEFPIAAVSRGAISDTHTLSHFLLFRDLTKVEEPGWSKFSRGIPKKDSGFDAFLKTFEVAVDSFRSAGIVHFDLYPSNIFWRRRTDDGSDVEIKIIDWDLSHSVSERFVPERMRGGELSANDDSVLGGDEIITTDIDRRYLEAYRILGKIDGKHEVWRMICDEKMMNDGFRLLWGIVKESVRRMEEEERSKACVKEGETSLIIERSDATGAGAEEEEEERRWRTR